VRRAVCRPDLFASSRAPRHRPPRPVLRPSRLPSSPSPPTSSSSDRGRTRARGSRYASYHLASLSSILPGDAHGTDTTWSGDSLRLVAAATSSSLNRDPARADLGKSYTRIVVPALSLSLPLSTPQDSSVPSAFLSLQLHRLRIGRHMRVGGTCARGKRTSCRLRSPLAPPSTAVSYRPSSLSLSAAVLEKE
jgi:hypothetical protein